MIPDPDLLPAIAEEVLDMSPVVHIISIYVAATLHKNIAEPKVV